MLMTHTGNHGPLFDLRPDQGRIQGGLLGDTNFIKRGKTLRMFVRKCSILVLNSYPDPLPLLSEILYPPCQIMLPR